MIDGKKAAYASIVGAVTFLGVSIGSCFAKAPDSGELERPEPVPLGATLVTGLSGGTAVTSTTTVVELHSNTMGDDLIHSVQVKPDGSVLETAGLKSEPANQRRSSSPSTAQDRGTLSKRAYRR
jgi:hypothetical protein